MSMIIEIVISVLIVIGASFALIGSWGMVRLPTLMERLHGPTKATTLGLGRHAGGIDAVLPVRSGRVVAA